MYIKHYTALTQQITDQIEISEKTKGSWIIIDKRFVIEYPSPVWKL